MPVEYGEISRKALEDIASAMCVAARTAPKTRGVDNLVIVLVTQAEKLRLIEQMKVIAARDGRPSCERDAGNIADVEHIMIIGTRKQVLGLDCGYCGYPSCEALSKTQGVCSYNSMDLGIALGSAAAVAGRSHADNRMMYSIGKAALEAGILDEDVIQAIGIPLSATGKNLFFDRK